MSGYSVLLLSALGVLLSPACSPCLACIGACLHLTRAMACLQEANKQVPGVADTLCLAAKAWSDTCYMDEIQSPFKERLDHAGPA